jgi:iron complex transport system substrate-binding protein
MQRTLAAAGAFAIAATLLVACGDDDTADTAATTTSTTAEAVAPTSMPDHIVSMSPTATEMLFAIGAGDQVVAVDDFSNYPEEAPVTDLSAYEPNVEAIATYEPDLVVVTSGADELVASLDQLGIEVLTLPAATTLDDTYDQLAQLGDVTGHRDEADDVIAGMQADIKSLTEEVPERATPLTYFHELDSTLYSVTSDTFIGQLYGIAGLQNVADPADADGQSGGYPQLSAEFLVDADPDLIFLADTKCCQQTAETFAARPGFDALQAVSNGNVVLLDDDISSRWGPRVVDFLRTIIEAVKAVPVS